VGRNDRKKFYLGKKKKAEKKCPLLSLSQERAQEEGKKPRSNILVGRGKERVPLLLIDRKEWEDLKKKNQERGEAKVLFLARKKRRRKALLSSWENKPKDEDELSFGRRKRECPN